MTGLAARDRFRPYPMDGALHYFHARSGTHVRITGPRTRALRKTAPRVVMFGITNECNLACRFCSRDVDRESRWTVESAFSVLRGLSDAGVLEVAFGGGEPFLFPGFAKLVAQLHEQTALALNVTTNGTQLDRASWSPFAGRFGQVRVSVYGDTVWRRCADLFADTGQRWGANILVDDGACATLPPLLAELAAAGCQDVSLLGFVGEPGRLLSPRHRRELADIVRQSALPCRISVCFGSSLQVPRLLAGFDNDGDCGAGGDFITVTPDQRLQSCSFQEQGFHAESAAEILAIWRRRHVQLSQPSPRTGCARLQRDDFEASALPEVAIWQGFSGNNSGECVLVAKFQTVDDARAYLAELLPGWQPGTPAGRLADGDEEFSAMWKELFAREQVAGAKMTSNTRMAPADLVQVGKSVLGLGYGVDDNFPELRALAWKRGALVLAGGVHVHEPTTLFGAIAARDEQDRDVIVRGAADAAIEAIVHGRTVFVRAWGTAEDEQHSLAADASALVTLASGRPVAAEIFQHELTPAGLVDALKHIGPESPPVRARLWVRFPTGDDGQAEASRFAATMNDQQLTLGGSWVLIDPVLGRKRVAVLAYRRDAAVTALDAERVMLTGYFWRSNPAPQGGRKTEKLPMPAVQDLQEELRRQGQHLRDVTLTERHDHNEAISGGLLTDQPGRVLRAMESVADRLGLSLWPSVSDPDPLRAMLRRLRADLD